MAYTQATLDAAKKYPKNRSSEEQADVDDNLGDLTIKNADTEARRLQGIYG